jgi:hypothetical protein
MFAGKCQYFGGGKVVLREIGRLYRRFFNDLKMTLPTTLLMPLPVTLLSLILGVYTGGDKF